MSVQITGLELLEEIGRGGMATVWKARQVTLDRVVAVKILGPKGGVSADDIARFQKEAKSAARLKHRGIIQVYDANAENGVYYFVMEFVAGYTVGDWVRRKGVLTPKDALTVADAVADALGYAWSQERIVHCDIKPDNVMVDIDGAVKVADLGIARSIHAIGTAADTEDVLGTPQYMAPEQARGAAVLDCRADIYALGAMLYHLVTGKLPFEGLDEQTIMEQQLVATIRDAMDVNRSVPKPLAWLLERMMAKDPANRHASWPDVRADIERVRKGHMPAGKQIAAGLSTMQRSKQRVPHQPVVSAELRRTAPDAGNPVLKVLAGTGIALLVVVLVLVVLNANKGSGMLPSGRHAVPQTDHAPNRQEQRTESAQRLFLAAQAWQSAHSEQFDEVILRLEEVVREGQGTRFERFAADAAEKVRERKRQAVAGVLAGLDSRAAPLLSAQDYAAAAGVYTNYTGTLVVETARDRSARAQAALARASVARDQRTAAAADEIRQLVVNAVFEEGLQQALVLLRARVSQQAGLTNVAGVAAMQDALRRATAALDGLLASYAADCGKTITLDLVKGPVRCTISSVRGPRVEADEWLGTANATRTFFFTVDDLSPREVLTRLGSDDRPDVALVKGSIACRSKAWQYAKVYFAKSDPSLRESLLAHLETVERQTQNEAAEADLRRLLSGYGLNVGLEPVTEWPAKLRTVRLTLDKALEMPAVVTAFRQRHGHTAFGREADQVLQVLETAAAEIVEAARAAEAAKAAAREAKGSDPFGVDAGAGDGGERPRREDGRVFPRVREEGRDRLPRGGQRDNAPLDV